MKKIFLTILLLLTAFAAEAGIKLGGQFSINFDNEHTVFNSGLVTDKENAYMINLKPKVFWNINEKMQVGGRVGFAFGRLTTGTVYDKKKPEEDVINRALGWSVSPFYSFRILDWDIVDIWIEANVFFGQYYNMDKARTLFTAWDKSSEYGFQILPVVNIDISKRLALQLHLGFISLGWYGTSAIYPNKTVTTNSWDIHKGGFGGLLQGLAEYGIGIVRKF